MVLVSAQNPDSKSQVTEKFLDNAAEAEVIKPGSGGVEERQAQIQRQRAFLKRGRSGGAVGAPTWRPRKKYRVGARNWLLHMDNHAPFGNFGVISQGALTCPRLPRLDSDLICPQLRHH